MYATACVALPRRSACAKSNFAPGGGRIIDKINGDSRYMTVDLAERQLHLALEHVPVPMIAHDETGRVRFLSDEFLRLTGYRAEQIPTLRAWLELAYDNPDDVEGVIRAHNHGYDDEPHPLPRSGEYQVRIADGSKRIWLFRAYSIGRGADGLGVNISMAIDVTAQRASLDALGRSETQLRQALKAGGLGSFERDVAKRVIVYSDELMAMHGLPEDRRVESFEQCFERLHPADRARMIAYCETLADPEGPRTIEYRIRRLSDGGLRRIVEQREPQFAPDGRFNGCVGVQRDVTETRAAEQALRESEARMRLLLSIGGVGTFDWDLAADRLNWDDRVREIWGVGADEPITAAKFYAALHPDDRERIRAQHEQSRDPAEDGAYAAEYRVIDRRHGRIRYVSARGRTFFDGGRAVRMMGAVLEVTALREAASVLERDRAELERLVEARTRELAEAQTRLAHAERMESLGQLAGGVAHDFNNVLQAIEAATDLIERKPEREHLPRYLRMLREAVKRGGAISRRLSSLSRRAELEPETVATAKLIDGLSGVLKRTGGPNIRVKVELAEDCPDLIADRRQLEAALLNIAANAREAMEGAGELTLAAHPDTDATAQRSPWRANLRPGAYVRLEVRDTGRGMTPEVRARAVEPFFSTKPRGQGVGLGLSMARGFADQSGGALKIDSEPGQGARIAIWLPVAAPVAAEPPAPACHARGRLLLVDDDPLVRELVSEQLRDAGYSVTVCAAGRAALDRLDSGLGVDCLVTDFAMPEMNGVALALEARKRLPLLPVVVLTGYAKEAAEAADGADFTLLRKPIDSAALIGRVAAMITAA
jgi:PAS domain S-box-containing protein